MDKGLGQVPTVEEQPPMLDSHTIASNTNDARGHDVRPKVRHGKRHHSASVKPVGGGQGPEAANRTDGKCRLHVLTCHAKRGLPANRSYQRLARKLGARTDEV